MLPTYLNFNQSSSGTFSVRDGSSNGFIRFLGCVLIADDAEIITIRDEDDNVLVGPLSISGEGGFVLPTTPVGYALCPIGKGLRIHKTGSGQLGGCVVIEETGSQHITNPRF
jgi:hypothetical protein